MKKLNRKCTIIEDGSDDMTGRPISSKRDWSRPKDRLLEESVVPLDEYEVTSDYDSRSSSVAGVDASYRLESRIETLSSNSLRRLSNDNLRNGFNPSPPTSVHSNSRNNLIRRHSNSRRSDSNFPEVVGSHERPGSSRFRVLPGIGQKTQNNTLSGIPADSVENLPKDDRHVEGERFEPIPANKQEQKAVRNKTDKVPSPTNSSTSDQRSSLKSDQRLDRKSGSVPSEPGPDEERIALAVKLPNGNRVQRYFSPFDSLKVVLQFVETSENSDYSGCEFMCHETKNILNDFRKTIRELNLADKTVLYIQLPAE